MGRLRKIESGHYERPDGSVVIRRAGRSDWRVTSATTGKTSSARYRTLREAERACRGDCYETAVDLMHYLTQCGTDRNTNRYRLCHGIVTGQEHVAGVRFGHAWVEFTSRDASKAAQTALKRFGDIWIGFETVYDHSGGRQFEGIASLYYAIGCIEPSEVKRYTYVEMLDILNQRGHYGPWELPEGIL